MKEIQYSLTFLGSIEVEDDVEYTDDEIRQMIKEKYYDDGFDFEYVNDVDWSVVND